MKQIDFANDKIFRTIVQTAIPMLIAQVLNLLYNIVDRIYISRIPRIGTTALGAVGLCFPIVIIITAFTNLYAGGAAPLFSIARGKGKYKNANKILNLCFSLELISGLILLLLFILFGRVVLSIFGADAEGLRYALPYLRIYLTGTVFSMIAGGLNPLINAQGFPGIGMMTVILGAVSNLILDPIFIFLLGMGVSGAAVATVISQGISAGAVLIFLTGKRAEYRIGKPSVLIIFKEIRQVKEILALGIASFMMQVTNSLVQIVCNRELTAAGGHIYVSVMTILSSIRQMMEVPLLAMADGTAPIISFNYGARNGDRIKRAIRILFCMMMTYALVGWGLIVRCSEFFIGIFTNETELTALSIPALHIYFFAYIFMTLQYTGQTVFKSMNYKKQSIFFSLLRKVIIVVPLSILLPRYFGLGTNGVFIAEPVSNFIGGTACFIAMLIIVMPGLKKLKPSGEQFS